MVVKLHMVFAVLPIQALGDCKSLTNGKYHSVINVKTLMVHCNNYGIDPDNSD